MTCKVHGGCSARSGRRIGWPLFGLFWVLCAASSSSLGAELGAADQAIMPPPGMGLSVVRLLGAFVLVMSLALGGVWLLRNWTRFSPRSGLDRTLKVLEVRMLGGRQSLMVVGYEGQRMLLATSPAGVSFLCRLPAAAGRAVEPSRDPDLAPTFLDALSAAVGRRG